ncbi:MAG: cytochrome d ubiquinol oxidase subunit II [Verrucomicrobiota bacterium]
MTPALIVAVFMVAALIIYALMGGADFGGGMWDFLATGPRAVRQKEVIARAIGPIWEANHVWLILVVVLLFTGFPLAFAAIMTALNIPITLVLVGVILRGSTFIFRTYDRRTDVVQRRWSIVFGLSSFFTPFVEGITVGALATGQIRVSDGRLTSGFFSGWLTPFSFACGVFAVALFAFLAATYMTVETEDEPDLQEDFRRRAMWAGLILIPIALTAFLLARSGAPWIFAGLTRWWAPFLLGGTSCCALAALLTLWRRKFFLARVAAIGQVTLILCGWSLAQYPNFVTPDLTFANSAAPAVTLRLLIIALALGAVLLFPSLYFLFRLFKGSQPPVRQETSEGEQIERLTTAPDSP